jgi:hypothetical protein
MMGQARNRNAEIGQLKAGKEARVQELATRGLELSEFVDMSVDDVVTDTEIVIKTPFGLTNNAPGVVNAQVFIEGDTPAWARNTKYAFAFTAAKSTIGKCQSVKEYLVSFNKDGIDGQGVELVFGVLATNQDAAIRLAQLAPGFLPAGAKDLLKQHGVGDCTKMAMVAWQFDLGIITPIG